MREKLADLRKLYSVDRLAEGRDQQAFVNEIAGTIDSSLSPKQGHSLANNCSSAKLASF